MYPSKLLAKPLSVSDQQLLIASFKDRFLTYTGLQYLYLIGSASRFTMTEASDLDFIAIFTSEIERNQAKKLFYTTPRPVEWPCDVLWYTENEFQLRSKIGGICQIAIEDGIKLIEPHSIGKLTSVDDPA